MYESRGILYLIWWTFQWPLIVWLLLSRRRRWQRDTFALLPPPKEERQLFRWWRFHLWTCIRRIVSSGRGGLGTVAFGVLSIQITVITFAFSVPAWNAAITERPLVYAAVGVVLSVFLLGSFICYAAYLGIRALPPVAYAELVLAGKPPNEQLKILAWEVYSACSQFQAAVREIADCSKAMEKMGLSCTFSGSPLVLRRPA